MWLLDRFSSPLWRKVSKLGKRQRRTVATALCSYDFFRRQVEKKLIGPAEAFLKENAPAAGVAGGVPAGLRTYLVDEALLGLVRSCRLPPSDPGRKLPRDAVFGLPELWAALVLADMDQGLNTSPAGAFAHIAYSRDPDEAHAQVLARWIEILGLADPDFVPRVNAAGFTEAWDWLARMFIADTLEGIAIVPDRMLFAQARRVAGQTPPHRARLIERFIDRVTAPPVPS